MWPAHVMAVFLLLIVVQSISRHSIRPQRLRTTAPDARSSSQIGTIDANFMGL
jgi:hypothetical protein